MGVLFIRQFNDKTKDISGCLVTYSMLDKLKTARRSSEETDTDPFLKNLDLIYIVNPGVNAISMLMNRIM